MSPAPAAAMVLFGPLGFLALFVCMWLGVSTLLAYMAGWPALMARFPDKPDEVIRRFGWRSGSMGRLGLLGGVNYNGILDIRVCRRGLRLRVAWMFGPFLRPVHVPWSDLSVTRSTVLGFRRARLEFGRPEVGCMTIPAYLADAIARAAGASWPEPGPFPRESLVRSAIAVAAPWLGIAVFVLAFFLIGPLLASNGAVVPSTDFFFFLLPAAVFSVPAVIEFARRRAA